MKTPDIENFLVKCGKVSEAVLFVLTVSVFMVGYVFIGAYNGAKLAAIGYWNNHVLVGWKEMKEKHDKV